MLKTKSKILLALTASLTILVILFAPILPIYNHIFTYVIPEGITADEHLGKYKEIPITQTQTMIHATHDPYVKNVKYQIVRANGSVGPLQEIPNSTTNVGMNWTQHKMFDATAPTPTGPAHWIALSTTTGAAISYTNTTCGGETTGDGLDRVAGTKTYGSVSSGDYTTMIYYNFTYTGAAITLLTACLMTDASVGAPDIPLAMAALVPGAVLGLNDKLNVQWNIAVTS